MDILSIKGLCINASIGVHAWEQRILQRLLIDIDIPCDVSQCNDELDKTINYDTLCQQITKFIESRHFNLIETVANSIAELITNDYGIKHVSVSVSKPHAIKNAADIRITITRMY